MIIRDILKIFATATLASCSGSLSQNNPEVAVVGAMKDVMWKGELHGKIYLDTLSDRSDLYGLGPLEYLKGEIMVLDGISYQSTVRPEGKILVDENSNIRAPFFAYARISEWHERMLPDSILTMKQLEAYLDAIKPPTEDPFMFKLSGVVDQAVIHVLNLPEGASVSSPAEAHQGQVDYSISDDEVDIVGFFSTAHQTIFTHHDTFLHMHLITKDQQQMGHLDEMQLQAGSATLFLPFE